MHKKCTKSMAQITHVERTAKGNTSTNRRKLYKTTQKEGWRNCKKKWWAKKLVDLIIINELCQRNNDKNND